MAVFPDLTIFEDMENEFEDGVEVREYQSGRDSARDNWGRMRFRCTIPLGELQPADEQTLREFYFTQRGKAYPFYFFHPSDEMQYSGEAVDETPSGSLDTFTIPAKTCSNVTVYIDDVEESSENYSLSSGTGTNGEDQIVFDEGYEPQVDEVVTVDFTGRKRYWMRFNGTWRSVLKRRHDVTMPLVEVFV